MTQKSPRPSTTAIVDQLVAELLAELPEPARQIAADVLAAEAGELQRWMTAEVGAETFKVRFIEPPADV